MAPEVLPYGRRSRENLYQVSCKIKIQVANCFHRRKYALIIFWDNLFQLLQSLISASTDCISSAKFWCSNAWSSSRNLLSINIRYSLLIDSFFFFFSSLLNRVRRTRIIFIISPVGSVYFATIVFWFPVLKCDAKSFFTFQFPAERAFWGFHHIQVATDSALPVTLQQSSTVQLYIIHIFYGRIILFPKPVVQIWTRVL